MISKSAVTEPCDVPLYQQICMEIGQRKKRQQCSLPAGVSLMLVGGQITADFANSRQASVEMYYVGFDGCKW